MAPQHNSPLDLDVAPRPPRRSMIAKIAAPIGALAIGAAVMGGLIAAGSAAEKGTPPEKVDLVEATTIDRAPIRAVVRTTGTVVSDQQVQVTPEVAGRLTWISESLVPGGRFSRGEVIARVDSRDYQVAVDQAQVQVHQAELELHLEKNRVEVATREWQLLGREADSDGRLARREPHLAVAEANVAAARAGLRRAELNLSRTRLQAPFNAIVLAESVDVGQVVGAGAQVAVLSGTDRVRVEASIPFQQLSQIQVPGLQRVVAGEGSPATVSQALNDGTVVRRPGRVLGVGGQLDPQSRTATLLIGVEDPLDPDADGLPLMVGAFVDVRVEGRGRDAALQVPRTAVYDGERVWVVDDGRLAARSVLLGWSLDHSVEIAQGLKAGDQVVTTPLSAPIAGTKVQLLTRDGEGAALGGAE